MNGSLNWHEAHTLAVALAREAGALLRHGLQQPKQIAQKSSAIDLATEYDHAAERLILTKLRHAFPDHRLLGEEAGQEALPSGRADSPFVWYVDPLDGTNNFTHGYPFFAVSLALYESGHPRLGVVYDPLADECFSAVAGEGARLETATGQTRIRVSNADELVDSLLGTGFPYDRHHASHDNLAQVGAFLKRVQGLRRSGSAALDLAYLAAGRLDGFWEFKLSSWDIAAGILLVREAGGQVTDLGGAPFALQSPEAIVASNGQIHEAMLATLAEVSGQGAT
ncbi:MAG: inositol monophosphatase family protein [Candidatus Promineifilaceae bacterium]|nr:inositol monophosphatase family protein [Candidatus Promineifilaceae bacterium]